ncbi:MAG: VWA domain-containing protein [Candidatus Kapabacteria bacterium]|nr:VWA domain-containing protein [Candidatus Kapabacteria bacterium]
MKAFVQAITALVVPATMFAQGGAEIVHLPDYLPVRDLVASQRVRTQVVEKRMLEDRTEFTVVMTDDKGRTIGGYAAPYLQAGQDAAQLWREYVTTYLATPTTDDRLKVREERRAGDEKFAVAFVLDHSPSMTMPRAIRMQRAVQQALTNFEQDDFVSIVKFTSRVKTEVPLTSKKESYLEEFKVNGINVRNDGTAIYDATREGLEQLAEAPAGVHKILIVFTDGEDNSSSATLNQVKDEAKSQGAWWTLQRQLVAGFTACMTCTISKAYFLASIRACGTATLFQSTTKTAAVVLTCSQVPLSQRQRDTPH